MIAAIRAGDSRAHALVIRYSDRRSPEPSIRPPSAGKPNGVQPCPTSTASFAASLPRTSAAISPAWIPVPANPNWDVATEEFSEDS